MIPLDDSSIEAVIFSKKSFEPFVSAEFINCRITNKIDNVYTTEIHEHLIIKKSFSCLIEPEIGDLVLCSCHENVAYIINILEKKEVSEASINFDGEIKVKSKKMHIETSEELNIKTQTHTIITKTYDIDASSIRVQSKQYARITAGPDFVKADNIFIEAVFSLNSKAYRAIEKISSIKKILAEKILMG